VTSCHQGSTPCTLRTGADTITQQQLVLVYWVARDIWDVLGGVRFPGTGQFGSIEYGYHTMDNRFDSYRLP
jgi:hypothetical protein